MSKFGIYPLVMGVIGVLCLVGGVINYFHEEAFFASAEHDTATITKYIPDPNYGTADFCPVYEFTTRAGQDITYTGDKCSSQPDDSTIGQQEQVYIDPKNPRSIESKGLLGSEGSGLILGLAGCAFFPSLGLIGYFLQQRQQNRKKPNSLLDTEMEYLDKQRKTERERKKTGTK